jgi:chemotaxis protein MotB
LTRDAETFLIRLAEVLVPTSAEMRIEGHTDDVPVAAGRYASNWELSTARASAVVLFLLANTSLAPARLSAAGYGEFHPRTPNETPEQRALNRRVDVVVTDPQERSNSYEPPSAESSERRSRESQQ